MEQKILSKKDLPILCRRELLGCVSHTKNASTIRTMWALMEYANPYTLSVNINSQRRKQILLDLKISQQTYLKAIKELKAQGILLGDEGFYRLSSKYFGSLRLKEEFAPYESAFSWEICEDKEPIF